MFKEHVICKICVRFTLFEHGFHLIHNGLTQLCKQVYMYELFFYVVCEETLAPPENGFVSTPNGNTFLKMAEYECNIGYNLEGAPQRMCTMNGEWEGREPSCKIKGKTYQLNVY